MKKYLKMVTLICVALFCPAAMSYDGQIKSLEEKGSIDFIPPKIQTYDYPSGAKLYFLENRELPVVEMDVMVPVGSIHDPADKKGLLGFMMYGLRTGGTTSLSGDEVDKKIENMAISLDTNAGGEVSFVSGKSLKRDQDLLFDLFFDVLKNPRFDNDKLELGRKQMLQTLVRRNENPMSVARREFLQRVYGTQNVWARTSEEQTIKNISCDDIVKVHKQYMTPNHFWFVVTGDIGFDEAKDKIAGYLKNWENSQAPLPAIDPVRKEWEANTFVIDRDVKQSSVVLGHFGEKRFNPDKYALVLANYILGGSTFGSRLGSWIRTSLGLAYGITSSFGLSTDYGAFQIVASTQTDTTVKMIEEIKKTFVSAQTEKPVTDEELKNAKQAILNQMVFENDEPAKIVRARRYYDFYGYPPDYFTVYQNEIKKVSLNQVQEVLKKYFYPDKLIVLIVGNKKGMDGLDRLGTVIDQPLDND
ncbi:MAG: hypothetical protein ACD_73C00618G0001 [uncultured bacterium]|nr:MAG: hypothetical protein ACD_73C00618G0001 [uncultured bacterium]